MNIKKPVVTRIAVFVAIFCLFAGWFQSAIAGWKMTLKDEKTGKIQELELSGKIIKEDNGWSLWRASKGGYYFFSSDIKSILPSEPNDPRIKDYSSHCVFKQAEYVEGAVIAYIDTNDSSQHIFYSLNTTAPNEKGVRHLVSIECPLWCNGSIHEYEEKVNLGPIDKRYVFETFGSKRLVFGVSKRLGYIYLKGKGKVTFPNGSIKEFTDHNELSIIGIGWTTAIQSEAIFWTGVDLASKGYFENALEKFNENLRKKPTDERATELVNLCIAVSNKKLDLEYALHFFKALAYQDLPDVCIEQLKMCINLNPSQTIAYVELAAMYLAKNDLNEALSLLQKAIQLDPKYSRAHEYLGLAYVTSGDSDKAIQELSQAILINPKSVSAHFNLAMLYGNNWKRTEAREELLKTIEIDPNHAEAHYCLAVAYFKEKEYDKAMKYCDRAIQLRYAVPQEFIDVLQEQKQK